MLRQPWRLENRFTCISRQPWARPFPILDSVFLATHFKVEVLQSLISDLPGGLGVKNLLSNAVGSGLIPGRGTKIPHAVGQRGPCAAVTHPMRHN